MKKVLEYLLTNTLAQIPKRGNKEMKSTMIDNRRFRFNKDKPISKVLQKKLVSVKNTNEYRSYALNKAKDTLSDGRVRNLLTKHAIRNKFREKDKTLNQHSRTMPTVSHWKINILKVKEVWK